MSTRKNKQDRPTTITEFLASDSGHAHEEFLWLRYKISRFIQLK